MAVAPADRDRLRLRVSPTQSPRRGAHGTAPVVHEGGRLQTGEITRHDALPEEIEGQADEIAAEEDERISRSSPSTKEKIWMMQDQLIWPGHIYSLLLHMATHIWSGS